MQTILLVDDDPSLIVAWGRLLRLNNFRVATAPDGEAGLAAAGDMRLDLIVTDLDMRGMNGVEFCRRLKGESGLAAIPIILASAGDEPRVSGPAWDVYCRKPVPTEILLASITSLLCRTC